MRERLLACLADGQFHSGSELGEYLGLTRAAVWKYVHQTAELGVRVDAVRGKGYRIAGGLPLLSTPLLRRLLEEASPGLMATVDIDVFGIVESTNTIAMGRPRSPRDYVCLAEQQSAGRGRLGRNWASPYGANVYASVRRDLLGGLAALEGMSLAIGSAVAAALEGAGARGIGIKWPNDLVLDGRRKVGGILVEAAGESGGACRVVVGVGVNLGMCEESAGGVSQPWADLTECGLGREDRNVIAATVVGAIMRAMRQFQSDGLAPFFEDWTRRDVLRGERVRILGAREGGLLCEGFAEGIDDRGGLRVRGDDGEMMVWRSGEVSVRRHE
jgi:BirA family biotin operon repressor/biotin-[acetyl-CoA-carboxylase] ligase